MMEIRGIAKTVLRKSSLIVRLRRLLDHTKGLPLNVKHKGVTLTKQPVKCIPDEDARP
jgi:hypothetical protein